MAYNLLFPSIFYLNWYIFVALRNKKLLLPLYCRLNWNYLCGFVKLIGYLASVVNLVSSNHCAVSLPRIKISLFLLSICIDELLSGPKIMTFFPILSSENENSERESSPML